MANDNFTKVSNIVLDVDYIEDLSKEIAENKVSNLRDRMGAAENKLVDLALENSYLLQRRSMSSDYILETFFDESFTNTDYSPTYAAEIMDDTQWNNNWKLRDGDPIYKNGFLRPDKQRYMLEEIDRYNLEGVGQAYKNSISRYDTTNECYWMMSNAGDNAIGEITKLSPNMKDGKVEVMGRWYITAGGASTGWRGIDVDIDNQNLIIVLIADGTTGGWAACEINSDGTLGLNNTANGGTLAHSTSPDGTDTYDWSAWQACDLNYWPADITIWDSNDFAVIAMDDASDPSPTKLIMQSRSYSSGSFNAPTATDITGFEYLLTGNDPWTRSLIRNGNDLWVRINDDTSNYRFIYKFDITNDIVSNVVINSSGRFSTSVNIDDEASSNEGITISKDGHILEITSTASNGKFISKRALANAVWAENQVVSEVACASFDGTNLPNNPRACMVESNRYYWTGDASATANQADVFRYDTILGTFKHCRLTGASWTTLVGACNDGTTIWLLGDDGTNTEVYFDSLSNIIAAMGDTYNITNVYDLTTGTLAAGIGDASTDSLNDITYDSDNDIIYLINDTDDKIDTLSVDGITWTQAVIDLPAPTNNWAGIAYKNNRLYIRDWTNTTTPNLVYVLDIDKSTSTVWYRTHIYQDPAYAFVGSGSSRLDFNDNNLVGLHRTGLKFYKMKVLEDPDVMQLHTFIDSNNILLSDYVYCQTPIAERYFDPEDFSDIRDCPDKYYMAVGYGDNGFSVLHLDKYISGRSSSGMPRYNVEDINVWHFKKGSGNLVGTRDQTFSVFIEKDIVMVASSLTAGGCYFIAIDLKSGIASYSLYSDALTNGFGYNGTLSERNDALGFTSILNSELALSPANSGGYTYKINSRTFTKEDTSDYNGENPKTFVAIGTNGGCDVLVIDWDSDNNRTPVKVWNNVFDGTNNGRYANWIAPSGTLFMGQYTTDGGLGYGLTPIWELSTDAGYDISDSQLSTFMSNLLISHVMDFSPNSRCWKLSDGTWRHQIIFGTHDTDVAELAILGICDVENGTIEKAFESTTLTGALITTCDNYEDLLFGEYGYTTDGRIYALYIFKKTASSIGWDYYTGYSFQNTSRPFMYLAGEDVANESAYGHTVRYSKDFGLLSASSKTDGLQLFHLNLQQNNSLHESIEMTTDTNPSSYHYVQSALIPEVDKAEVVDKTANEIEYTDGTTKTWGNVGTVQAVTLEDISNEEYASGTFGDPARALKKDTGAALVEGVDYNYDSRLDITGGSNVDIYDADNSGSFNANEYFRIVENGTNIATGLGLDIYAKNLSTLISPPSDQAYVDPASGKFVLPRPIYWSKCESESNVNTPEIGSADLNVSSNGFIVYTTGKFNNCLRAQATTGLGYAIHTLDINDDFGSDKFAVSAWVASFTSGSIFESRFQMLLNGTNNYISIRNLNSSQDIILTIDGSEVASVSVSFTGGTFHHLYAYYDGTTFKVYYDGVEEISYACTLSITRYFCNIIGYDIGSANASFTYVDNLKIWNHVPSTTPTWEYNSGTGREDALHDIYGATNDYKPIDLDVGYHFLPTVIDPAQLEEDGATEGYLTWDLASGFTRAGVNFVKGADHGIAKVTVTEDPNGTPVVILNGETVDLYDAGNGEVEDLEFTYWFTLDETKDHEIKVEHNGDHHASSASPYYIKVRQYLTTETLDNAEVEATLTVSHSSWSSESKTFIMVQDATTALEQTQSFNGDASTTDFVLSGTNRAYDVVKFTIDGGTTWKYPTDTDLVWGSNATDYDDETIDSNGYFGVKFDTAPVTGTGNVQIYYIPAVDTYKVTTKLKMADDDSSFTDKHGELRLQDHSVELIL